MYASKERFNGLRASMGRVILYRSTTNGLEPLTIVNVQPGDIIDARSEIDGRIVNLTKDTHEVRSADDVDEMPCGAWTWPPRV